MNKLYKYKWHLLLMLAPLLLLYPGIYGGFWLDDYTSIPPTFMDSFDVATFWHIIQDNTTGPAGRPISVATFALNYLIFGDNVYYFKVVNIILHIINGLLIFNVVQRIVNITNQPQNKYFALVVAFIWLIHPLQVSTVLYTVQRMTILSTTFMLLGIICYLNMRAQLTNNTRKAVAWLLATCIICYPLAILSKENAVILPFLILTVELFLLKFKMPTPKHRYYLQRGLITTCLLIVCLGLLYYRLNLETILLKFLEQDTSIIERLEVQINALAFYLGLIFFPSLNKMGLFHDDFVYTINYYNTIINSAVLILALNLIFVARNVMPWLAFGIAWFFTAHVIESSILPLEMVFEHRNYLAILGPIAMVVALFYRINEVFSSTVIKKLFHTMSALIVVLLCALTIMRAHIWGDTERFLQQHLTNHPYSARAHIEFANWLLDRREYQQAFMELEKAEALAPFNAGVTLHKLLMFCHFEGSPDLLYDSIHNKLHKSPLNPYIIMVLNTMTNNISKKQCYGIKKENVVKIIQDLYQHPFIQFYPKYFAMLQQLEEALEANDEIQDGQLLTL